MLAKELYQELESKITEENKEIIKGYFDLVKQKIDENKANFMNRREVTLQELNEKFNNKFEAGSHRDSIFIKNGSFNIAFFQEYHLDKTPHFLIEEVENGTTYRTVVTEKFTKTSSMSKNTSSGFKEQIGFADFSVEVREGRNDDLNLDVGRFVLNLLHDNNKSNTNKEIKEIASINFPESKASTEMVSMFVEHQAKLKDVINNKVENKVQQKQTI